LYDWIGRTFIRKTGNSRKRFPLLGERIKVRADVNIHSNKNTAPLELEFVLMRISTNMPRLRRCLARDKSVFHPHIAPKAFGAMRLYAVFICG
jgi:hypothetical protein